MKMEFLKQETTRDWKINQIVKTEWEMFQNVHNIGGRAFCQDDYKTFYIMRYSQASIMDDATLDSYQQDLKEAQETGRNPLAEKYAYMMEYTEPEYYENHLKDKLPSIGENALKLAYEISDRMVFSERKFAARYPYFSGTGRPLTEEAGMTSLRTYALGELKTYSERTLKCFLARIEELEAQGENIAYLIHQKTADFYGYDSVETAEQRLRGRHENHPLQ